MHYSKSEAGKIGAAKTALITAQKLLERKTQYDLNPTKCLQCQVPLVYSNRRNKFCSNSCAAIFSNARKDYTKFKSGPKISPNPKSKIGSNPTAKRIGSSIRATWECLNCQTSYKSVLWRVGKYCSTNCQRGFQFKQKILNWDIKAPGKGAIKRFLTETFGYKCSECGISDWNGKKITLELEHKDGNSENNSKENLCLICPNCHSQTSTYKGKNKGKGRFSRRQRYAEGKSY